MSDIDVITTRSEILEYSEKDTVLSKFIGDSSYYNNITPEYINDYSLSASYIDTRSSTTFTINYPISIRRYTKLNKRLVGVIVGVNSDGSEEIALLGDDYTIKPNGNYHLDASYSVVGRGKVLPDPDLAVLHNRRMWDDVYNFDYGINPEDYETKGRYSYQFKIVGAQEVLLGVTPQWEELSAPLGNLLYASNFMTYDGNRLGQNKTNITLNRNLNNTLHIGVGINNVTFVGANNGVVVPRVDDIAGNVYDRLFLIGSAAGSILGGSSWTRIDEDTIGEVQYFVPPGFGTYAGLTKLYNVVLTESYSEAIKYLDTGELPTDAKLYPYDVDNIPTTDGDSGSDDSDTPLDTDGEDGNKPDYVKPTPIETPEETTQSLTNNNLYWLTKTQLSSFMDWFWTDATDVDSLSDLWDKIQGLYSSLSEAVINIRYIPIDASWVGGTTLDTSIIVGPLEKQENVLAINKTVSPIRDIGTINIKKYLDDKHLYGTFCDYSPYTQMYLYLPYHGFIDLDVNLVMYKTIAIRSVYDIMSGTVQYFIFRDGYDGELINTVITKIANDIPITLQTKNERDSAIFTNVSNSVAGLIGATTSISAGNPIGLVMSAEALSGSQSQGAPFSLKGTVEGNGAIYSPSRCAIYIKIPRYNRPSNYASIIGYPTNKAISLRSGIGYVVIHNPYITYKTKQYIDNDSNVYNISITNEEKEEIESLLKGGVYL